MKKTILLLAVLVSGMSLFSQSQYANLAPGAINNVVALLNKPAMVSAPNAAPLGRNWFTLVTDIHVFTQDVTVRQVAAALTDFDNQENYFNGKKSKQKLTIVSKDQNRVVADYVSIMIVPIINIQLRTPYRAEITTTENTAQRFVVEFRQLESDSSSNNNVKNLYVVRYAEEVMIGGRKYTYIRMYVTQDVNASILPGAKATLENSSTDVNVEALQLIIAAAKTK